MSLTVSYYCWLSLTVCPSALELLHVSNCLLWFMAVSHCLSGPMDLQHISHCLYWFLAVSQCLSLAIDFAACLSL